MTALQERLAAAFRIEHREHLQTVRAQLDGLIAAGYDPSGFDFTEAYRRVHSLKGAARAVGLSPVEALAHQLETLMAQCQSGQRNLDRDLVSLLHAAFDEIEEFVSRWTGNDTNEPLAIQQAVAQVLAGATEMPPQMPPAAGPAARPPEPQREPASRPTAEQVRVETAGLDAALRSAGELVSGLRQQEAIVRDLRGVEAALGRLETMLRPAGLPSDREAPMDDIAARASLDGIRAQLKDIRRRQEEGGWLLGRLSRQLFGEIRSLRIMPAETVFGGIGRMVRDLARQEGKQALAVLHGGDSRVDREVLQALKDPVMHLLRNAVSHGIEPPAVRQKAGKPAEGRIALHVAVQRSHLVIRIEDDGAGLNVARIRDIAIERGLLPEDAELLEADSGAVTRLLVDPGFTTAPAVTEISGRGIGLAVVDQAIQHLQGTFRLVPRSPAGSEAVITVPLAVIGTRVLQVRCRGRDFLLPVHAVRRLCRLPPESVETVDGEPMAALPECPDLVPLAGLGQILELEDGGAPEVRDTLAVILLQAGSAMAGIVVDDFVSVLDAVIHGLGETLPGHGLLAGIVALPDGAEAAVINPSMLAKVVAGTTGRLGPIHEPVRRPEHTPLVLVVDDSITTRTLEKSILESKGFRVRLAVDGLNALELLDEERPNLVISDIEMPRMGGFELLHSIKNDERYAGIPVILVTSRDDEQDRHKGLMLGAAAYIVKQSFDQWQLLETVEQLL